MAMAADSGTTASVRAALERKAEIYEKLKRGKTGGLSEARVDALLVDVSGFILICICFSITEISVIFRTSSTRRKMRMIAIAMTWMSQ